MTATNHSAIVPQPSPSKLSPLTRTIPDNRRRCKRVREKLFLIPIHWRQSHSGSYFDHGMIPRCLHIDAVGLFFFGNSEKDYQPDFIRTHIMDRHSGTIVLEAQDEITAIEKFYNEIEGARVGGNAETEKAIWIDREIPIRQLAPCMYCWQTDENWEPLNLICGDFACTGDYCGQNSPIRCHFHPEGNSQFTCEDSPCDWDSTSDLKHTGKRYFMVNDLEFAVVTDIMRKK